MPTKYPKSAQTGERACFVRTLATEAGGIFRAFENADVGIDGAIELLTDERGTEPAISF